MDLNMNFLLNFQNKEIEFIKEAFINVSKYSTAEIIITDEKFNILFQNARKFLLLACENKC